MYNTSLGDYIEIQMDKRLREDIATETNYATRKHTLKPQEIVNTEARHISDNHEPFKYVLF